MKINVYIGVIGSGKDYSSKEGCDLQMAFADSLREDVWSIIGWAPKTDEEYDSFKECELISTWVNKSGDRIEFTGREMLQRYGTLMRELYGEYYWSDRFISKLKTVVASGEFESVGISDARYSSEIKSLIKFGKENGVSVSFKHCNYRSDRYDPSNTHESEKLAQKYLDFEGTQEEFNELIYKEYEINK